MRLASLTALAGGAAALIAPPVAVRRPASVLRADWQRYEDAASGDPYWHDADSGETTWDDPTTRSSTPTPTGRPPSTRRRAARTTTPPTAASLWDWPPVEAPVEAPAAAPAVADAASKLEQAAQAKAAKQRHDPGDPCRYMSRPIKEEEAVVQEEKTRLAQAVEEARNIASSSPPSGAAEGRASRRGPRKAGPTSGRTPSLLRSARLCAYDDLGAAITQRSVQTQLQYSAALRNEAQVSWLSKFWARPLGTGSCETPRSAGPPSSYTPALCQLEATLGPSPSRR